MGIEQEYTKQDLIDFGNFLMEEVESGVRKPEDGVNGGCVDMWLDEKNNTENPAATQG